MTRRVIILGSTGSIGVQTLRVIDHLNGLPDGPRFEVVGLAAGRGGAVFAEQSARWRGARTALAFGEGADLSGPGAAERLVREVGCDLVVGAIVGIAGLRPTLAAIELGRDVALANKETLVAAGPLMVAACARSGSRLLPVDSEHAAVWQALGTGRAPPMGAPAGVERVILTASGGPFREWSAERIARATPAEALRHPTWSMGPKVTIDSASMMNKALEIIEAHFLFGVEASRISAVVHPSSTVHGLVELADGSVVAQLARPDMRIPIQNALTWPRVCEAAGDVERVDWTRAWSLAFEPVDAARFPALGLAHRALSLGGTAGAVLNAVNEEAVAAFLRPGSGVGFGRIAALAAEGLEAVGHGAMGTLEDVFEADARARAWARGRLG